MGCHTWFYKKIEVSKEEIYDNVLFELNSSKAFYDRMIIGDIDEDLLEAYPEWTPEFGEYHKKLLERQIRIVESGICEKAVYRRYNHPEGITVCIDGKGHYITSNGMPHDLFRKYGYPEDKLFSYKETLDYIYDKSNECELDYDTFSRLEQFWYEYPDGMIKFG